MTGFTPGQLPVLGTLLSGVISGTNSFVFNGFNLSDCGEVGVDSSNHDDINKISLETYDAPRKDGGGVLGYFVNGKTINVKVVIKKETEEELNELIDLMKLKLFKQEGLLEIMVNGVKRVGKASLTSLNFNRNYDIKEALSDVTMSFVLMNNMYKEIAESYTENSVSTNTYPLDINNPGHRCGYKLYFIFSAASGTNLISILKDGYTLSINQAITAGDILIIDSIDNKVTYNGVEIDYSGVHVELNNGSNPMLISINGTYSADITWIYNINYL